MTITKDQSPDPLDRVGLPAKTAIRAILQVIPFGGAVTEIYDGYVEAQRRRTERFATSVGEAIQGEVETRGDEAEQHLADRSDERALLLEEGIAAAHKAHDAIHIDHIATLVAHGLTRDQQAVLDDRRILKVFKELDGVELIRLLFHHPATDDDWFKLHRDTIVGPAPAMGSDPDEFDQEAARELADSRLMSFGLLEVEIGKTGRPRKKITKAGQLLLDRAGLKTSLWRGID